jgi:hypothetical protein
MKDTKNVYKIFVVNHPWNWLLRWSVQEMANNIKMGMVSTYKATRRQNPEQQHRHVHRRENLKSHMYHNSCEVSLSYRCQARRPSYDAESPLQTGSHLEILPWWWSQQAPLKRRLTSTRLHGATSQKTVILILAAVRTWNLTKLYMFFSSPLAFYMSCPFYTNLFDPKIFNE